MGLPYPLQIRDLSKEAQTKVLFLHNAAFVGGPCETCKGRCCRDCAMSHGYLSEKSFGEAKEKYGFDGKKGFLGEHGCMIPIRERSEVCVQYQCYMPPAPLLPWDKDQQTSADELRKLIYKERDAQEKVSS